MDAETFASLARAQYELLPEDVRALTQDVEIRVADEASPDVLASMGIDHPLDLLGLFQGVGLSHGGGAEYTGMMPNRVWLYRLPILAYQRGSENSVEEVIRHVLVHEIGHHFGLSDDDMYAIDDADD
ncbi:metallopeptidase family protein [Acuticoccus sediminis]|uniref:metallopeptidase family protein n=1 Tax=Acuticoccus sediminis TaxID=2184697 RepID=UPI001CFC6C2A|nr:metallopeptidase family protein [Acuticoccus sediminis]